MILTVNLEAVDFNEEWTSLFQRHALLVVVVVIVVVLVVVIVVVVEVGVGLGSNEDTDDGVGGLVALDVDVVAERLVVEALLLNLVVNVVVVVIVVVVSLFDGVVGVHEEVVEVGHHFVDIDVLDGNSVHSQLKQRHHKY